MSRLHGFKNYDSGFRLQVLLKVHYLLFRVSGKRTS